MGNGWVCYMDIYRHLLNVLVFLHTNCCLLFICWQNTHYNFSQVNFVHLLKSSGLCKVTGANLQAAEVDVGVHVARGKRRDRNEFFASRFDPCPTFFCFPPSPFSGDPMELPEGAQDNKGCIYQAHENPIYPFLPPVRPSSTQSPRPPAWSAAFNSTFFINKFNI